MWAQFLSVDFYAVFRLALYCLGYYSCGVRLGTGKSFAISFLKFSYSSQVYFHMDFRINLSISRKKGSWYCDRDCIEYIDQFKDYYSELAKGLQKQNQ